MPLDDALAFLPAVDLAGDDARRAAHGVAVAGTAAGHVRLRDDDGLIALAEPRADGDPQARRRLPRLMQDHSGSPMRSTARATSPSASSTACTSATAR